MHGEYINASKYSATSLQTGKRQCMVNTYMNVWSIVQPHYKQERTMHSQYMNALKYSVKQEKKLCMVNTWIMHRIRSVVQPHYKQEKNDELTLTRNRIFMHRAKPGIIPLWIHREILCVVYYIHLKCPWLIFLWNEKMIIW